MRFILKTAITILVLIGCTHNQQIDSRIRFSGYSIPIEGGRINMKLDSITQLDDLIPQLDINYKLYETYKGYLIGYNDLMFSIAVYSDKAIDPLIKYISTTRSYHGKVAALYTLHLIGINCNIEGGTYEEFTNRKARKALINLLAKDNMLQNLIMSLLIRDPRESDIPDFFHIMDSLKTDCSSITSGLLRYDLKNIPVAQDVPDKLLTIKTDFLNSDDFPSEELLNRAFKFFASNYKNYVFVEDTLFNYKYNMSIKIGFEDKYISLDYLTKFCTMTYYSFVGPNFQYFYKDGKINFCSAMTTKRLWMNWWKLQNSSYKDSLQGGFKKIGINRI